mmetsp:Transcript_8512/g.12596  ORF Transcript_8512/g.12596 Transcript_8512/m.12596 type:complete len:284 (-) Transcript_8512:170-1021(-)|eukprot:CAMPEP_0196811580 /NCGR_PEP_ID=MMETSP1362-20130617/18781_1 /TAXON_ID=163516 /ORGANISM="Leptocylindrus danicus, Strain CCMP1856" /LENGTH=283 /DNA_ID=CAMNT_0042186915 /DNA_START=56 /DNA_END=907 /DNA_ORIENTATION=+
MTNNTTTVAVPPLYFTDKHIMSTNNLHSRVPSEILSQALTEYCDYGTLARLSCVSRMYKDIVRDAASNKLELAVSYLEGKDGLAVNFVMAVRYLKELVDDEAVESVSRAKAIHMLAKCYLAGDGAEQDTAAGTQLLEDGATCATLLDTECAHTLANLYENGDYGVELCPEKAAHWFHYAADLGHVESMAEYALHLELGVGVEQNDSEALNWYLKAANAGHVEANYSIGECYEEAKGVPLDHSEACLWYFKSASKGCNDSVKALERLSDVARIVLPGYGRILEA